MGPPNSYSWKTLSSSLLAATLLPPAALLLDTLPALLLTPLACLDWAAVLDRVFLCVAIAPWTLPSLGPSSSEQLRPRGLKRLERIEAERGVLHKIIWWHCIRVTVALVGAQVGPCGQTRRAASPPELILDT